FIYGCSYHDRGIHNMIKSVIYNGNIGIPDQTGTSRNIPEYRVAQGIIVNIPPVYLAESFVVNEVWYFLLKSHKKTSISTFRRLHNGFTHGTQDFLRTIPETDSGTFRYGKSRSLFL